MATWYTPRCTKKFWHPSSWVYKNYPVSELAGGGLLPEGPRAGVGHLLVRFVADLALQDRQVVLVNPWDHVVLIVIIPSVYRGPLGDSDRMRSERVLNESAKRTGAVRNGCQK